MEMTVIGKDGCLDCVNTDEKPLSVNQKKAPNPIQVRCPLKDLS